jgi:glycosyltransferase involved in cell wall biosynthesis
MESGINKKPNILILTSFFSNDNSSKMIMDISKSFENDYNVDVLSKYPFKGSSLNVYSAYNHYEQLMYSFWRRCVVKLSSYSRKLIKEDNKKTSLPYYFFGLNEENPPVKTKRIVNQIKKDYDFILVFFWQGMITSKTLKDIHDKIKKPILLLAADMFPMTGGCSYFWDCERLEKACGKCPGLLSNDDNDITRKNFLYKKEAISGIKCIFLGNNWQINHAAKSGLFNNMGEIYPIVDENVFKPRNKIHLKEKFNCSNKVVLFFGALGVDDPRKGFEYLINSLQLLSKYRPELINDIVLFVAGKGDRISALSNYAIEYTGHLTFDELAEYYAMADIFLSPSIQDAGPMMLNQALMCGTPAVAFNIGVADDVINDKTGYLAKYRDSEDFCRGIIELISKTDSDLKEISKECRKQSLQRCSYEAFRKNIINSFNKIK